MKLMAYSDGYTSGTTIITDKTFTDLPKNADLANYVYYGVMRGWINPNPLTFRPNDNISQGEVEKLILVVQKKATATTDARPSPSALRGWAMQKIVD
jgi:hypothetical protein